MGFSSPLIRPGVKNFYLPNKGKIVANRYVSTATRNTLEAIGTNTPELAALVAVVIGIAVLVTPLVRGQLADLSTDAQVMKRYLEHPRDFPTTERYLPMNEYMPDQSNFIMNLYENVIPKLSDKLETLLDLWKQTVANHVCVPRFLADILSNIMSDVQYIIDIALENNLNFYSNVVSAAYEGFYNFDWGDLDNWLNIMNNLHDELLTLNEVFMLSGLIT